MYVAAYMANKVVYINVSETEKRYIK